MYISNNGKFKEGIVWWDTQINDEADVDIFFFIHDYDNRAKNSYGFKTLEIDLSLSKEEILMQYKSRNRNQVKAALLEGFEIKQKTNISQEEVNEYVEIFNSFAEFKKIGKTSIEYITALNDDSKLFFTYVYKDGILIAIHSHYVDHKLDRARLMHSFSTNNEFSSRISADANKLLTHEDIKYFKDLGVKTYDFGGIGNAEGDNTRFEGIIRFKKQFGGKEVILWKGTTPNGKRGEEVYKKYFSGT